MKTFCPNCEKETECTFTAELYECEECGEDFAKYIVGRTTSEDKSQDDELFSLLKTEQFMQQRIEILQLSNKQLQNKLSELSHRSSQQQKLIQREEVEDYAKSVHDLIRETIRAITYNTEEEAKNGMWALPKYIFELMLQVDKYTAKFYNGDCSDDKIITGAKRDLSDDKIEELRAKEAENRDFNNY